MGYEEMLNTIYNQLIDKPGVDMCGAESRKAMRELEKVSDHSIYMDMLDLFTAGFEENARNGFYYGFQCAIALLTGNKWNHNGGC